MDTPKLTKSAKKNKKKSLKKYNGIESCICEIEKTQFSSETGPIRCRHDICFKVEALDNKMCDLLHQVTKEQSLVFFRKSATKEQRQEMNEFFLEMVKLEDECAEIKRNMLIEKQLHLGI